MLQLICQERFRTLGIPVDIGPFHNHGTPWDAPPATGTAPGQTAISFPHPASHVAIESTNPKQWNPLAALRIEIVANVNPAAARTLTLIEGDGAFRFSIMEEALEASFAGPSGPGFYVRSDETYAPDGRFHHVPAHRWATLGVDHNGYSTVRLSIDGKVVGEANVAAAVPPVLAGGVTIGNNAARTNPLLGVIDEVRVWRIDPTEMRQEFWCRPHTRATARCWEEIFRAVREWGASHPADLAALLDMMSAQQWGFVRALFLLPSAEQTEIRAILKESARLWCEGLIDGNEMRDVLDRWIAALRRNGLAPSASNRELEAIRKRARLDHHFALACDPKAAGFLLLLEHAVAGT
jgi:hypothetical protein